MHVCMYILLFICPYFNYRAVKKLLLDGSSESNVVPNSIKKLSLDINRENINASLIEFRTGLQTSVQN